MIRASLEGLDAHAVETLIVGSGPAGITLALELARRGIASVVLESGAEKKGPAQELSSAEIVDPERHDSMDIAVSRRLGGTSNLWGGRCVPLDSLDFQPREFTLGATWPIGFSDIERYYEAACRYSSCGEAVFEEAAIGLALADNQFSMSRLERASNKPAFQKAHRSSLANSKLIDVRLGATVVDFDIDENGCVKGVGVVGHDGRRISVKVGRIVLAAGGLETTRLMLSVQRQRPDLFGGADGPLGRYYMGHIIGDIADVVFTHSKFGSIFDFWRDGRGSFVRRRICPDAETQRLHRLPNISFWPVAPSISDARHRSGALSAITLALSVPGLGGIVVPEAIRKRHLNGRIDRSAHIANILQDIPATVGFLSRFSYRRYFSKQRIPGYFVQNSENRYGLAYSSEQSPRAASRVTLDEETDRTGLPRLKIDYRCHQEDAEAVARAHSVLEDWLKKTGIGRLEYRQAGAETASAIAEKMGHGTHQIGTARMGSSRREGVVDSDLRSFDCRNLFVLGSTVFPTSGQANPTLSVVAFAVRLAECLSRDQVAASGVFMGGAHA